MTYDIHTIRAQFPGLALREGNKASVSFDNAAGTQIAQIAIDRMVETMIQMNSNVSTFSRTCRRAEERIAEAHAAAADFINAREPSEVFFGQNMTTLTFSISGSLGRNLKAGDEIILSRMDHEGNVSPWLLLTEDLELEVKWLDFDPLTFEFDLSNLEALVSERTKLVAVCYASNMMGTINDIAEITRLAHSVGALVFVDAVQFAPHGVVDVQKLGCDFLVCSAYKFFGPHYELAWGRRDLLEQMRAYKVRPASEELPFKFVTGTTNREELAGVLGAIEYYTWVGETFGKPSSNSRRERIVAGAEAMNAYERVLTVRLIEGLKSIEGIQLFGITDPQSLDRRVPTFCFRADTLTPKEIARYLSDHDIDVRFGDGYAIEVCAALGIDKSGGAVRVGLAHYNTIAEVELLVESLGSGSV